MPSAASFASNPTIKMLLIGHSKSRKTSSLSSLLKANYRILVADFDNNLDFLIQDLAKNAPSLLKNLLYVPLRDSTRIDRNSNVIPVGTPHAFEDFQMLLDEGMEPNPAWAKASKEDRPKIPRYIPLINPDTEEPIGPVPNLGTSWIFVIDSLWAAGRAAFLQHGKMQPSNDPRKTYYGAGQMLLSFLDAIKDPAFTPHVIVISHMTPVELARAACRDLGIEPVSVPIRGGTDGSRLTEMGVPCPNIFTGMHEIHGPLEWVSVQDMGLSAKLCLRLVERAALG